MDSLTQITLGAAVGEAVAGRRIGNRAMLWGAIAGTIPDLDVFIGNIFMNELNALAFHRGITHSLAFAVVFPLFLVFLVHKIYDSGYYQKLHHKRITFAAGIILMVGMTVILILFPYLIAGKLSLWTIIIGLLLLTLFSYRLYSNYYAKSPLEEVNLTLRHWYIFFFLTIVTHPILDCFTTYGTQLFQPFSDYRVSWNNISVLDPLYTGPFFTFLIIASFLHKTSRLRSVMNWSGILISSAYMIFTFANKFRVNQVFVNSLKAENIAYHRFLTTPTIANNILWNCVAEMDSFYYVGLYSLLDEDPVVKDMAIIPINNHLIKGYENDPTIRKLSWFSDGYNTFIEKEDGSIQMNDLRFGRFGVNGEISADNYIFKFVIEKNDDDVWALKDGMGGRPENPDGWLVDFWKRIKGI